VSDTIASLGTTHNRAAPPQRLFCPLCGREATSSTNGHYFCCGNEYIVWSDARGQMYLKRTLAVWRDLNDKNYNAIVFADAEAG